MTGLLAVPIVAPLLGTALSVLAGRARALQRTIGLLTLTVCTAVSVALLVQVDRAGTLSTGAGGHPAPMGIGLVADRFAAVLLVVAEVALLAVLVYAIGEPGAERNHVGFQSAYLILSAGVAGSLLTGDLFSLFVSFEMMLTASYVLLTLGGRREQIRAGMTYIIVSLIASTLFVTALALLYSATGTVNMADLADRIGHLPQGTRTAFAVLLIVVFGIKAAIFPLFFWLPDSYPTAPSPITAVFAGLLTKIGVYAMVRTQLLLFPPDSRPATLLLVLAGLTMVVGVLGAIAQDDIRRILSFTIVSQIGFMVMGLGLFTVAAIAALIFSMVHHIVVKTSLFLVAGLVEETGGDNRLSRLGDLIRRAPAVAVLFLLAALSLAGVPPFSGFVSKLALLQAGVGQRQFAIVAVSLVVSLLTLFVMARIWTSAFWSRSGAASLLDTTSPETIVSGPEPGRRAVWRGPVAMMAPTATMVAASLAIAVAAGPVYAFCERAATDLVHPRASTETVLGP
ncbi:MAG: Na+/H+ antiporter subunit D [Microthrixaceae bacterium]